MVDNFETIEKCLLKFTPGSYYKFEALIRNTDGENDLYCEGMSKTNKNILIKSWWVEDWDYYLKIHKEMKHLCDHTGARLYVNLDRRNLKKTLVAIQNQSQNLIQQYYVLRGENSPCDLATKTVARINAHASSIKESSDRETRMWMFDIDTNDFELLRAVQAACYPHEFFTLATKKGWHVCVYKRGFEGIQDIEYRFPYLMEKYEDWSLSENSLGLVYMPDKVALRSV